MLVEFFKRHHFINIRVKLIIIYVLNLTDIIFTLALLQTGYFQEANLLMRIFVENSLLSLIIKGILPLILLSILYIRLKKASNNQIHIANIAISGCLIYYGVINISHIIWTLMYVK